MSDPWLSFEDLEKRGGEMANTLFLDIETVPTQQALEQAYFAKEKEALTQPQKMDEGIDAETLKTLSLSACTARVLCVGYAMNQEVPQCVDGLEEGIIRGFWLLAAKTNIFVGYNILDFDLRFIWQRSMILGIRPSREIPFIRFRQAPVFDVMQEWHKWAYRDHVSLDVLARAFGLASPKADGLDGSKVYQYYCEGRLKEIYDYCKRDVETVRKIYQRIAR